MDKYANFAELKQNEKEGEDYAILYRELDSEFAIMAPHGGGIEPGTIDIADAIAGSDHVFYAFKGLKTSGNRSLHITSDRFDEPTGVKISENAWIVVSIHGSRETKEMVLIGGLNRQLAQKILKKLNTAGFEAVISEVPGLQGIKPENICNRCKSGKGVQLEISRGLREKMFENLDLRSLRRKTKYFNQFVGALKMVLFMS